MYTDEQRAAEISFPGTFPIAVGGLEVLDPILDRVEDSANQGIESGRSGRPRP